VSEHLCGAGASFSTTCQMVTTQSPDRAARIKRIKSRGCPEIIQALPEARWALKRSNASADSRLKNNRSKWLDIWKLATPMPGARQPGELIPGAAKLFT